MTMKCESCRHSQFSSDWWNHRFECVVEVMRIFRHDRRNQYRWIDCHHAESSLDKYRRMHWCLCRVVWSSVSEKATSRHNKRTRSEKIWYRKAETINSRNRESKEQDRRKCSSQRIREFAVKDVNALKVAFTLTILVMLMRLDLYALWAKRLSIQFFSHRILHDNHQICIIRQELERQLESHLSHHSSLIQPKLISLKKNMSMRLWDLTILSHSFETRSKVCDQIKRLRETLIAWYLLISMFHSWIFMTQASSRLQKRWKNSSNSLNRMFKTRVRTQYYW
jgi:hypothetical protein